MAAAPIVPLRFPTRTILKSDRLPDVHRARPGLDLGPRDVSHHPVGRAARMRPRIGRRVSAR